MGCKMFKRGDIVCYVACYRIEFGRIVEVIGKNEWYRIVPLKKSSIKRKRQKDLVSLEQFSKIVSKEQSKKPSKLLKKN